MILSNSPERHTENSYESTTPEDTSELARKNAIKAKQHVRPVEAYTPSKNMFSPTLRTESEGGLKKDSSASRLHTHDEEEVVDSSGEFDLDHSGYSTENEVLMKTTSTEDTSAAGLSTVDENQDHQEEQQEEMDEDVFNPYHFIAYLPDYYSVCIKDKICLPPYHQSKPTLVLDLDETLVHCTVEPVAKPDLIFPVE